MIAQKRAQSGFTLIESLVSIAIFSMLVLTVYETSASIVRQTKAFRENTTISALADKFMEVARNLPYSQVGTLSGNPHGNLYDQPNATTTIVNNTAYQIYYVVNYIDDPADGTILAGTDFASNDYKQVKLYIKNTTTGVTKSFLSNIVPKGLENLNSGGALFVTVFDAVGQPVPNATVVITNTSISPSINLTRTTDSTGHWIEVGLPNSANSYHVVVSKTGYSSDQTYPSSAGNPNPVKGDATISNGQVTQISFSIDLVSSLVFNTLNATCAPIAGVGLKVQGAKLIGIPDILKFDNSFTSNASGKIPLSQLEWDNYTPTLSLASSYMIYGSSPIQQINILPNVNQSFDLILGPKTANSLLVIVKDAATGNPIKSATAELRSQDPDTDVTKLTSGNTWGQQAWNGGSGQADFSDATMYAEDDGNVNVTDLPSGIRLAHTANVVNSTTGTLTSSTFDTGTASTTYTTIAWQPTSQTASSSAAFQIAANNDNATWNFVGPDGTPDTFYTVPGSSMASSTNGNRYIRYKAFLSTTDVTINPVVTSTSLNYVSGCFAPGQAMFPGLDSSASYDLDVSMPGYQSQTISNLSVSGYNVLQVSLSN